MSSGISILMYHQVGQFAAMRGHRSTYCDHRRFAAQMGLLKRLRYNVLSMDQVLACLAREQPIPPRAVALTFDDGYENFYEYAFPVLHRYEFPAMVYLITDLIGQPSAWFAQEGRDTPLLMGVERIRQLRSAGIDFGSHGATHRKLAEVDADSLHDEVFRSKQQLEALLDEAVDHFCYPYGSHNLAAAEAVAAAGYASAVTCQRAAATPRFDPLLLPRKAISFGDNLAGYLWKLQFKDQPKRPPLRWRA